MSEHMPITFLVRMSREFVETAMSRTMGGDKITFELSEPDAEGVREVKFMVHYDDNIIASSSARVKELESFIVALWYEFGIGGDIDGGWLQDEMEKRGLIVPHVVTEDEYDEESEFGPGDTIYHLSPAFKRLLRGEESR